MSDDAGGSRRHAELPPELRQLAQTLLDRLDPAVRLAAARVTSGGTGKCDQVWCPVCALAALVTGEQHPLLTIVAEHSTALLTVIRAMLDASTPASSARPDAPGEPGGQPPPDGPEPPPASPPPAGPGRYEHIPVTFQSGPSD